MSTNYKQWNCGDIKISKVLEGNCLMLHQESDTLAIENPRDFAQMLLAMFPEEQPMKPTPEKKDVYTLADFADFDRFPAGTEFTGSGNPARRLRVVGTGKELQFTDPGHLGWYPVQILMRDVTDDYLPVPVKRKGMTLAQCTSGTLIRREGTERRIFWSMGSEYTFDADDITASDWEEV